MGLDMSLDKIKKGKEIRFSELEEVMYWRKANQIHNWFVDNVQDGNDDCGFYEVSKTNIEKLLEICEEVVKNCGVNSLGKIANPNIAKELLPTCPGFFFGSTDYDEFYIGQIKNTIPRLKEILETFNFEEDNLIYSSSW